MCFHCNHCVFVQLNFVINVHFVFIFDTYNVPVIQGITIVQVENAPLIGSPGFLQVFFVGGNLVFLAEKL